MHGQRWITAIVALMLSFGAYGCEGEVDVENGGGEQGENGGGGVDLEGEIGGEGEGGGEGGGE